MDYVQIIALSIILIAFAISGYLGYKKAKDKGLSIEDFLQDYVEQAIEIAQMTLKMYQIKRENFKSDEEYEREVIQKCMINFRKSLVNIVNPSIFQLLTDDVLEVFFSQIFHFYREEVVSKLDHPPETAVEVDEPLTTEAQPDDGKEEKTSTLSALNDFYKDE